MDLTVWIVVLVVAMIVIVTSGLGAVLVAGWRVIALTLRAIVHVPLGLVLILMAVAVAWYLGDLIGFLIGGVLLYYGGNYLFGAIGGFVENARRSKTNR